MEDKGVDSRRSNSKFIGKKLGRRRVKKREIVRGVVSVRYGIMRKRRVKKGDERLEKRNDKMR